MATSTFEKVSHGISNGLHDVGERIVDFKDDAARDLSKRVDMLGGTMKKYPLWSIGIGVGVGIGAGFLLARIIQRD